MFRSAFVQPFWIFYLCVLDMSINEMINKLKLAINRDLIILGSGSFDHTTKAVVAVDNMVL